MVDNIKKKYSKNNRNTYDSSFNKFIEPKIIEKTSCKPCIISYLCFTILNTIYLLPSIYLYYNLKKYTKNDIFTNPDNFNEFLNNLKNITI